MKKYILTITLLLVVVSLSFSQEYQMLQAMDFFRANKMQTGDWAITLTENDIQGSPYLNNEFSKGNLYTNSKMQFVDVPLRYNIYNDQLEFKTPEGEVLAMAAPEIIESVKFGDNHMVYIPYSNVKKIKRGFFVVVLEGKASLYAKPEVNYKKPEEPGAYKEAEPAKFIKKPNSYYIRIGAEQARKVISKKELPDLFPDHKEEISAFVKKNKTKTNKADKLKALVEYYNTL